MPFSVAMPTTRYRALIQLLRTAEDLWNASRDFFAHWDLSPSQFNLLNVLFGQIDGLSQSELSRLLIMHRSNATGLIDRLERRGLVRRNPHPSDRRAYRVILTDAGVRLLEAIYPHYYAAADRVWAEVPESKVGEILDELQNLAANASAVGALSSAALPASAPGQGSVPGPDGAVPAGGSGATRSSASEDPLRTSDL